MPRIKDEGKPHQRDDGTWVQWLDLGYVNGKRLRKKVEGATRQKVKETIADLRRKHAAGIDIAQKPPKLRVFLLEWLTKEHAQHVKRKSLVTYQQIAHYYIFPDLGDLAIDKITVKRVSDWLAALAARGLAAKTRFLARAVLRQALRQAVDWELLDRNPVDKVRAPKAEKSPAKSMTIEQARALLTAAQGHRLEVALQIALSLGLRRAEVCGLKWDDIDTPTSVLTVRQTVQYIPKVGDTPGTLHVDTPKTESGARQIKVPRLLLEAIQRHRERQQQERLLMHGTWKADAGFVFVAARTGDMLSGSTLYAAFRETCAKAGISGYRFHDLRHSCASFLFAQGIPLKVASELLGHANTTITENLYTHLLPGTLDTAADAVERLLFAHERAAGDEEI